MSHPILKTAARAARFLPGGLRRGLYRLGPLTGLIRKALTRAAPVGPVEVEIAAGPARGFRMVLDLKTEKDAWLGTYEPQLQQALADFAGGGMTVYDVGANIGSVTLMLAAAVGDTGQVYAFEALPENVERLRRHVRINELESRVRVTHAAVVDGVRTVGFAPGPSHATGKASAGDDPGAIPVPGISLDHFVTDLGHPPPDLVKIDIEGGETLALPGMKSVLALTRPVVLLELHGQEAAARAWEVFTGAGYTIHAMRTSYPAIEDPARLDRKAYVVCLPAPPA